MKLLDDLRSLTAPEYRKQHAPLDPTQMLVASPSRYEDMLSRRIYIDADLPEITAIRNRGKIVTLCTPGVIDIGLFTAYLAPPSGRWFLRPPFILPASQAPWSLEPGRVYRLASGGRSTPFPAKGLESKQVRLDWMIDNSDREGFLPTTVHPDAKRLTPSCEKELNVMLWDDMRGPGLARQAELQTLALKRLAKKQGLDDIAHLLPDDHELIFDTLNRPTPRDEDLVWHGQEEAVWAAVLDDPDIKAFTADRSESVDFAATRNLFIESDNLLALKMLRSGHEAKVRLTYIDPPYNTGNKFVYNDSFKSTEWTGSPFTGQRWGEGTWRICQDTPAISYVTKMEFTRVERAS